MFKHILVPLDGSSLAEQALPVAARIARATEGIVELLHVSKLHVGYGPYLVQIESFTEAVLEADIATANLYLNRIAHSKTLEGVKTCKVVIPGLPIRAIPTYAQLSEADLIVMVSHGYTGFKRWALGSIAQKVIQLSPTPVLILRGDSPIPEFTKHPMRILVALDGSPLAEAALLPAAQLCAALASPSQGKLHLVRVIPSMHPPKDGAATIVAEMHESALSEAEIYLSNLEQRLRGGDLSGFHLKVASSVISCSDVADTLIRAAELGESIGDVESCEGCGVIAMATHGRQGLEHLLQGSVAERILGSTQLPLFVVHSPEWIAGKQSMKRLHLGRHAVSY